MADERDSSIDPDLGDSVSTNPVFGKGAIVMTPTNYVARVTWVQSAGRFEDGVPKAGVEYLEHPDGHMVYKMDELKLIAQSADKPKWCDITAERLSYEREEYLLALENVKTTRKAKAPKSKELGVAEKLIAQLTPEQLTKLLEEL